MKDVTLSNGQYDEFPQAKPLERIGSVVFDTKAKKIAKLYTADGQAVSLDPVVASRFLSVDPLARSYPFLTPYQFAGNSPVKFIDLDGLEPAENEPNYGKNVMFGLVNETALKDEYLKNSPLAPVHQPNDNWIAPPNGTTLIEGANFIKQLHENNISPTNVVFTTHGNVSGEFMSKPRVRGDVANIDPAQLSLYITGFKNDMGIHTLDEIQALESIFANMQEGGTFILNACECAANTDLGPLLQQLAKGRINIYLTYDRTQAATRKLGMEGPPELDRPRISYGIQGLGELEKGYVLYPAGYKDENKQIPNDPIPSTTGTVTDMKYNTQGNPVQLLQLTPPKR